MPHSRNILRQYLDGQVANLTPEWYQIKNRGLTSTNVAAVLEYDIYKSKMAIHQRKVHQASTLATNEAIRWGLQYEPVARQLCGRRYARDIVETGLKMHPEMPFLGATPDGISYNTTDEIGSSSIQEQLDKLDQPILHEFKCLKSRHITRKIPLEYWVQMQVAMEVWNLPACLYSENSFQEYNSEQQYLADTRTPPQNRGILPIGTNIFLGASAQNPDGIVRSTVARFWYLREHWDYLVYRDTKWFQTIKPKILEFWQGVLNEQERLNLPSSIPLNHSIPPSPSPSPLNPSIPPSPPSPLNSQVLNANKKRPTDSIEQYTSRKRRAVPQKSAPFHYLDIDWSQCTRANQLDAFLKNDPILDWLELYGPTHGYQRDPMSLFQMQSYIYQQNDQFKNSAVTYLKDRLTELHLPFYDVFQYGELEHLTNNGNSVTESIGNSANASVSNSANVSVSNSIPVQMSYNYHSVYFLNRTKEAIQRQVPVIFNGLLMHPESRIFGRADIIIKEDLLSRLFPNTVLKYNNFSSGYICVCLKYATLDLNSTATSLLTNEKQKFYQLQSLILTEALSALQMMPANHAYLLARKLKCMKLNINSMQLDCNLFQLNIEQSPFRETLWEGLNWLKTVKQFGASWDPQQLESVDSKFRDCLRPNMKNRYDSPWHQAKIKIAHLQAELTQILNLGFAYRQRLIRDHQIQRWDQLTPEIIKEVRIPQCDLVSTIVTTNLNNKACVNLGSFDANKLPQKADIEFFIDFETVNDLYDDFANVPNISGFDMIYLIGCVVIDHRSFNPQYHCFIADDLTSESEERMICQFLQFLSKTLEESNQKSKTAHLYHWTMAEPTHLNKALARYHPESKINLEMIDLYKIFRDNQITVKGSFSYGLKAVAKAFHAHGLIATTWKDGLDGAQASVGAWRAMDEVKRASPLADLRLKISETQTMQMLIDYNYNDCQVLYEMTMYLRQT